MNQKKYLVEYWFRDADYYPVVRYEQLEESLCNEAEIAARAWWCGAEFALCEEKFGSRIIKPRPEE